MDAVARADDEFYRTVTAWPEWLFPADRQIAWLGPLAAHTASGCKSWPGL